MKLECSLSRYRFKANQSYYPLLILIQFGQQLQVVYHCKSEYEPRLINIGYNKDTKVQFENILRFSLFPQSNSTIKMSPNTVPKYRYEGPIDPTIPLNLDSLGGKSVIITGGNIVLLYFAATNNILTLTSCWGTWKSVCQSICRCRVCASNTAMIQAPAKIT